MMSRLSVLSLMGLSLMVSLSATAQTPADSLVGLYDLQKTSLGFCPPSLQVKKSTDEQNPLFTFACEKEADCTTTITNEDGSVTTLNNSLIFQIAGINNGLQVVTEEHPMTGEKTGYHSSIGTFYLGRLLAETRNTTPLGLIRWVNQFNAYQEQGYLAYEVRSTNHLTQEYSHNLCLFKKR
jgi:hypothetical protein